MVSNASLFAWYSIFNLVEMTTIQDNLIDMTTIQDNLIDMTTEF